MSEKTIPVWLHQNESEKIQIGVAAEVDPETGAQPIEIWPEFKELQIENFTIGDAEPVESTVLNDEDGEPSSVLTREEFRALQDKENEK